MISRERGRGARVGDAAGASGQSTLVQPNMRASLQKPAVRKPVLSQSGTVFRIPKHVYMNNVANSNVNLC